MPSSTNRRRRSDDHGQTRQITSPELLTSLLEFIQGKFYQGRPKAFAQDKRRLLDWVILWPARWLNTRGVTLPAERYRQIFTTVILDALRCGNTGSITYLPAYLAKVILTITAMKYTMKPNPCATWSKTPSP